MCVCVVCGLRESEFLEVIQAADQHLLFHGVLGHPVVFYSFRQMHFAFEETMTAMYKILISRHSFSTHMTNMCYWQSD